MYELVQSHIKIAALRPMFPSIFVSHGAPDLPLHDIPATNFLRQLGSQIGSPKAILVVSAHWLTRIPTVTETAQPATIHDFSGFAPELYQVRYPVPGAPELAEQIIKRLTASGMEAAIDRDRGLDHGAWVPLMLMYPKADIPVVQLSLQPRWGTTHHLKLGQALKSLRKEGILILCSGAVTHNLRAFQNQALDAQPPQWVTRFDRWVSDAIARNDVDALLRYREVAPYAIENHPTEEHLLPLFVALGAGGTQTQGTRLHSSYTHGILSMAAYKFAA